mmetsp:Transcript_27747/g.71841  ORF Transcript_27747/g.71841 Transcript_27747/m.71841 type:complete len:271 (+) Transcript_27747:36-848(+)
MHVVPVLGDLHMSGSSAAEASAPRRRAPDSGLVQSDVVVGSAEQALPPRSSPRRRPWNPQMPPMTSPIDKKLWGVIARMLHLNVPMVACWCLVIIATCVSMYFLYWLKSVLVPAVLAVFLTFLLEPVLWAMLKLPELLCVWPCQAVGSCRRRRAAQQPGIGDSDATLASVPLAAINRDGAAESIASGSSTGTRCGCDGRRILVGLWEIVSVLLCVIVIVGFFACLVAAVVASLVDMNWERYQDTSKVQHIFRFFEESGNHHHLGSDQRIS